MKTLFLAALSLLTFAGCSSSSGGGAGGDAATGGDSPSTNDSPGGDTSVRDAQSSDMGPTDSTHPTDAPPMDSGAMDSGAPSDAPNEAELAHCGQPGDMGNSLGVGKYCMTLMDCSGNSMATICTYVFDNTTNFCTFSCTPSDAGNPCGDNATCQCNGGPPCGCTPNYCIGP